MELRTVKLEDITLLEQCQIRARISKPTVEAYVASMKDGIRFDPITLISSQMEMDGGELAPCLFLADGFHRYLSFQERGIRQVEAQVVEAEPKDAIVAAIEISCASNSKHGLRLSSSDKRHAIKVMLAQPALRRKGDRPLGQMIGVSAGLVKEVRSELAGEEAAAEREARKPKKKAKPVEESASEPAEAYDMDAEKKKMFLQWVEHGFVDWPMVIEAFQSLKDEPLLLPQPPHQVQLIMGKSKREFQAIKVSVKREDGVRTLIIEGEKPAE